MADWTTLDLETLLPGEPLTSAKVTAMYENPIAITEGAPDAPRIRAGAVVSTYGFVRGTGSGTDTVELDNIELLSLIEIDLRVTASGGNSDNTTITTSARFSADGGTTFGAWQQIHSVTAVTGGDSVGDMFRSVVSIASARYMSNSTEGALTIPAGCNAAEVRCVRAVGGISGGSATTVMAVTGKGQRGV